MSNDPIIEHLYLLYNKKNLITINNLQGPILSTSIEDKSKHIRDPKTYNSEDYLIELLKEYIASKTKPNP
jgi:hypothetical protein